MSGPPADRDGENITARIRLDSINDGARLTTWELTYPRFIHAELMTHRAFSRNAASSRAIPPARMRERIQRDPAIPISWGANRRGMVATDVVSDVDAARAWWFRGRDMMLALHEEGERLGLHKQIVNRVVEPWMMITVVCSMTDHAGFYHQRDHGAAEDNFRALARRMWEKFSTSMPRRLCAGEWHLPFVDDEDRAAHDHETLRKIAVGRLARVSYLTHDGVRDWREDVRLHDDLAATAGLGSDPMHASPFEHAAVAANPDARYANFRGWRQYRAEFASEAGPATGGSCHACGMWPDPATGGRRHVVGCHAA